MESYEKKNRNALCNMSFDDEDGSDGNVTKPTEEQSLAKLDVTNATLDVSNAKLKEKVSKKNTQQEEVKQNDGYEYEKSDLDFIRFSYTMENSTNTMYFEGLENEAQGNCFFEALVDAGMFNLDLCVYAQLHPRN